MKKPVEPRTIGKINITDALKNVEVLLEQEKSISPQVRAMMDLLVVVIHLLLGKLGLHSANSRFRRRKILTANEDRNERGRGRSVSQAARMDTTGRLSNGNRIPIGSKPSKSTGAPSREASIEAWVLSPGRSSISKSRKW